MIYDPIRKKKVPETPEEKVRQWFIQQLLQKNITPVKIQVEYSFKVGLLYKRADLIVFDNAYNPKIVIECKAPNVAITQKTLNQVSVYNLHLKAPFLIVTNGMETLMYQVDFQNKTTQQIFDFPI